MEYIDKLINKSKKAQNKIKEKNQKFLNKLTIAAAWSIYKDENAKLLAGMAVADTGLGNVTDKIKKNKNKIIGSLSDILDTKTRGTIIDDKTKGIKVLAKPIGVIASLTPSTNAAATPANHIMFALKCGNSIIISPSPKAQRTVIKLVKLVRRNLVKLKAPADLVQCVSIKNSLEITKDLSSKADLVIATGDKKIVKTSYSSGKPSMGVSLGNVPVIISLNTNFNKAVEQIIASKTFDNATSCSSENSLILQNSNYSKIKKILQNKGAYFTNKSETKIIIDNLFVNNKLNPQLICKPIDVFLDLLNIEKEKRKNIKFLAVDYKGVGNNYPLSGEKLSLILTIYKVNNFDESIKLAKKIINYQGKGHSAGIYSNNTKEIQRLAENLDVSKIIVNQPHALSNGGGINNSLPFSFTIGCGSWGENSFSENLNINHFYNKTTISKPIKKRIILSEKIFNKLNS